MGKTLYLECYSGISGDMTVAALLGLGADWEVLKAAVDSLAVDGFEVYRKRVTKSGISAWDFEVRLDEAHENHDHDMEYLHGAACGHEHGPEPDPAQRHAHEKEPDSAQKDGQGHGPDGRDAGKAAPGRHSHRQMKEIREIIGRAHLTERSRATALKVFEILAQAEATAHGVSPEEVHFHEVGAVDSIVDIVAAAVCLDNLDVTEVVVPELYEGSGTIRCQHGILPVPVPAVVNIAQEYGLRLHRTAVTGELVTPTGAAIAAAVRTSEKLPESFTIEKTGIGAGKRRYECPGILRAMLIAPVPEKSEKGALDSEGEDSIWKLETNVDDCTGEMFGFCMERLFAAGALDVHYTPVFMKKNRPGWLLTVLCGEKEREALERIIFSETTTIGIRRVKMRRTVLARGKQTVLTPWGPAEVKVCRGAGEENYYPEYESLAAICRRTGVSYREACEKAVECAKEVGRNEP